MKIHNIEYIDANGKPQLLNVEKFISLHAHVEKDSYLSDWFQILYDSPNVAIWRANNMLDANDDYWGTIIRVDLKNRTLELGNDWSVKGGIRSYKEKKCNGTFLNIYKII